MDKTEALKELEAKISPETMTKLRELSAVVLKFIKSDEKFNTGHVSWLIDPMVTEGFQRIVAVTSILILQLDGKLDITDDGWFSVKEVVVA